MLSVSAQTLHAALYRSIYSVLTGSCLGTLQGFLGSFAKFQVVTIRFVISDDPAVRPSAQNNSATTARILVNFGIRVNFETFPQYYNFITISQDSEVLYMKTGVCLWIYRGYLATVPGIRNISENILFRKSNRHFVSYSYPKTRSLYDNVEKYCRTGKATDGNMAHAYCMVDTQGYKNKLRICNTCCFPTAKIVTRSRLNVTSHLNWVYCC